MSINVDQVMQDYNKAYNRWNDDARPSLAEQVAGAKAVFIMLRRFNLEVQQQK